MAFGTQRIRRDEQQLNAFSAPGTSQACDNFAATSYEITVFTFMRSMDTSGLNDSKF